MIIELCYAEQQVCLHMHVDCIMIESNHVCNRIVGQAKNVFVVREK